MKYAIQRNVGNWKNYYICKTAPRLSECLCNATLFNNRQHAESFLSRMLFLNSYKVVSVNEKDLFKARLSNS